MTNKLIDFLDDVVNDTVAPNLNYETILGIENMAREISRMNIEELDNFVYLAAKIESHIAARDYGSSLGDICLNMIDETYSLNVMLEEESDMVSSRRLNGLLGFLAKVYDELSANDAYPTYTPNTSIVPFLGLVKSLNAINPWNDGWLWNSMTEFYVDQNHAERDQIIQSLGDEEGGYVAIDNFFIEASQVLDHFYDSIADMLALNHMSVLRQLVSRYLENMGLVVGNMEHQFTEDDIDYRPIGLFIRNANRYLNVM